MEIAGRISQTQDIYDFDLLVLQDQRTGHILRGIQHFFKFFYLTLKVQYWGIYALKRVGGKNEELSEVVFARSKLNFTLCSLRQGCSLDEIVKLPSKRRPHHIWLGNAMTSFKS